MVSRLTIPIVFSLCFLWTVPTAVHAQTTESVCIPMPVTLATTTPITGAPVALYGILVNTTNEPQTGTAEFVINGTHRIERSFSLEPFDSARIEGSFAFESGAHTVLFALTPPRKTIECATNDIYAPAQVRADADTDGDGIPNSIDTDDDNDGISDAQEAANGTDPLVAEQSSAPNTNTASASSTAAVVQQYATAAAQAGTAAADASFPYTQQAGTFLYTQARSTAGLANTTPAAKQTSPFDITTPSKNLFDVSVEIITAQQKGLSWWNTIVALLYALGAWLLYSFVPSVLVLVALYVLYRVYRWWSY